MSAKNKFFASVCAIATISALAYIGTHLLPNSSASSIKAQSSVAHKDGINTAQASDVTELVRYTPYEVSAQPKVASKNVEFFNQQLPGIVVNQWRADTAANINACSLAWKDTKALIPFCANLANTMVLEVHLDEKNGLKKILVPAPLKVNFSIGHEVLVATGSFDVTNNNGTLPSITKVVNDTPYDVPSN